MAATYTLNLSASAAVAASKNMFAINNATGSGKIIKVYRIWMTSYQTAAVTGGVGFYTLKRYDGGISSGGTAVAFLPHSSCLTAGSTTPFTGVTAVNAATTITAPGVSPEEITRRVKSFDEITVGAFTLDEINAIPTIGGLFFDTGYTDATVQPITLRENQSLILASEAVGTYAGTPDIFIELTIE